MFRRQRDNDDATRNDDCAFIYTLLWWVFFLWAEYLTVRDMALDSGDNMWPPIHTFLSSCILCLGRRRAGLRGETWRWGAQISLKEGLGALVLSLWNSWARWGDKNRGISASREITLTDNTHSRALWLRIWGFFEIWFPPLLHPVFSPSLPMHDL